MVAPAHLVAEMGIGVQLCIESANCEAFPGSNSKPFSPWRINSGSPPISEAMTGRAKAPAS